MTELKWKATPKAKVYEAWSALADGRVTMIGGSFKAAIYILVDGERTTAICFGRDFRAVS
jgi:hypothetical protein